MLTQAARYERNEARQGYRSGHYDRNLITTSGDVTLRVPRLKGVSFETAIIELEFHVEHRLALWSYPVAQVEVGTLLRFHVEILNGAVLDGLAVLHDSPHQAVVAQVAEEVLVVDANLAVGHIHRLSPDVLILIGQFVGVRVELTVGTDDAVAVEIVV